MSATVIPFGAAIGRRIAKVRGEIERSTDEMAAIIAAQRPDLSPQACRTIASCWNKPAPSAGNQGLPPRPPAPIPSSDPVYALFDAFKAAQAAYKARLAEIARRDGRTLRQTAARMAQLRHQRGTADQSDMPA